MAIEVVTKDDFKDFFRKLADTINIAKKDDEVFITIDYVQKHYGLTKVVQQKMRTARKIPYYQVGRTILYKKEDIINYIEKHKIEGHTL